MLEIERETLPPGVNNLYWNIYGRGRVLTTQARQWRDEMQLLVRQAAMRRGLAWHRTTRLAVEIEVSSPRLWTFDLDGRLKLALDALAAGLGVDDRYIVQLQARKIRGPERLRIRAQEVPS